MLWLLLYLVIAACWGIYRMPHVIAATRRLGSEPSMITFVGNVALSLIWPITMTAWLALSRRA